MDGAFQIGLAGADGPVCVGCYTTVNESEQGTGLIFTTHPEQGLCNTCLNEVMWLAAAVHRCAIDRRL